MNTPPNSLENVPPSLRISSSFLADLIALNSPSEMAKHLCEQLSKLTKAKAVAFFLRKDIEGSCRLLYAFPPNQSELFAHEQINRLCPLCHPVSVPTTVREFEENDPLKKPLEKAGIQNLLRLPVYSGKHLTGAFILMNLPDPNNSEEIRSLIHFLGPTIALAIQNSATRQEIQEQKNSLEQQVEARTVELEAANRELSDSRLAALNMMEDAILSGKKMEFEQNLFRSFMDTLPAAVYFKDKNGRFISVNKAMAALFDMEPNQLIGKTDFDLFSKKQAEQKRKDSIHVMETGNPIELEELSGARWHHTTKAPRYDQNGNLTGIYGISWDITERKQTDRALKRSQAQYATLLSNLPGMAYLCDNDEYWTMRFISDGCTRITGYTPQDLIKNKTIAYSELIHPDDRQWVSDRIQESLNKHKHFEIEYRIITRNGEERWLWERGIGRIDDQNNTVIEGFISDITNRKEAQKAVEESEARFRGIYESMAAGVARVSLDFHFEAANQAYCDMLGYTEEELKGKHLKDITAPEVLEENLRKQKQLVCGETDHFRMEKTFIHKTGKTVFGLLDAVLVRNAEGKPAYCLGSVVDITERKKAESELRRLSTAIQQSPEAVIITDPNGIIEYVNPAFESITGYVRSEVAGKKPNILKSGEHNEVFYKKMWEALCSGNTWEGRLINRRKDGSTYTEEAGISPVRDEKGHITHYVAVKRDISQELAQEEQMKQAQKMEAIGQLAGGIAHDFNNILQAILGFSELLTLSIDKTDEQSQNNVKEIQKAARHAADLTRQLLAFSRKQAVAFTSIDLNDAVKDTLAFVTSFTGENIRVETRLTPDPLSVNADLRQIERTILNMAINARDAMPKGGILTFKTEHISFSQEDIALLPQARSGNFACLSISDTGTGMTRQTIEHIFEPFFSTKGPGKGTGLGLAAIYGIIQDHKGWINVYSEPGNGSTFKIYLPAKNGHAAQTAAAGQDTDTLNQTGHNQRILIVEDDPAIRRLSENALLKAGYQVECTSSAEEAEKLFSKKNGAFDLLFSDIILPGKNGAELAAALTEKNPDLAVILCSGYSGDRVQRAGIEQKGFFLLEKPFPIVKLLKIVHQVLEPVK